jgi:hypothetical protein
VWAGAGNNQAGRDRAILVDTAAVQWWRGKPTHDARARERGRGQKSERAATRSSAAGAAASNKGGSKQQVATPCWLAAVGVGRDRGGTHGQASKQE